MIKKKTDFYLRQRLQYLSGQVVEFKKQIDGAKTQFKKDYYGKKLKKAQQQAIDILVMIQRANITSQLGLTGMGGFAAPPDPALDTSTGPDQNVIEDN